LEENSYKIQIVKRYILNQYGIGLFLLGFVAFVIFIFSTAFDIEYNNQELYLIIGICGLLMIIGLILDQIRKYENTLIQFLPEGVILKINNGYIPIKYNQIEKIPMSNFSFNKNKTTFYLLTEDRKKFEIKIDTEIYDVLIDTFPEKSSNNY